MVNAKDDAEFVIAMNRVWSVDARFQTDLVQQLVVVGHLVVGLERKGTALGDDQRSGQVFVFEFFVQRVIGVLQPRIDVPGKHVDVGLARAVWQTPEHFVNTVQRPAVQGFGQIQAAVCADPEKTVKPGQVGLDRILASVEVGNLFRVDFRASGKVLFSQAVFLAERLHSVRGVVAYQLLVVFKVAPVAQQRAGQRQRAPGIRMVPAALVDHLDGRLIPGTNHVQRFLLAAARARRLLDLHFSPSRREAFGHHGDHAREDVFVHLIDRAEHLLNMAPSINVRMAVADVERFDDQFSVARMDLLLAKNVHHLRQAGDVLFHHDGRHHNSGVAG